MKLNFDELMFVTSSICRLLDENNIDVYKSDININIRRKSDNTLEFDVYGNKVIRT